MGEPVADAHKGNISVTSPIARALIGKTRGETVEVETPGGAKVCQVRKSSYKLARWRLAVAEAVDDNATVQSACRCFCSRIRDIRRELYPGLHGGAWRVPGAHARRDCRRVRANVRARHAAQCPAM